MEETEVLRELERLKSALDAFKEDLESINSAQVIALKESQSV
jgi:hypothetical protein